jgi:arabinan endo-1,5-alpha-L-arabinosidase
VGSESPARQRLLPYYAVSTLGHNNSVIGLATNTTLDPAAPGYRGGGPGPRRPLTPTKTSTRSTRRRRGPGGTPWLVFGRSGAGSRWWAAAARG